MLIFPGFSSSSKLISLQVLHDSGSGSRRKMDVGTKLIGIFRHSQLGPPKLLDGEELSYHHDVTGLGGTNMCCWKYGGSGCLGAKISQVDWLIGNTPVDLVVFAFKIWMCVFTSHSIRQYPSI